MDGRPRDFHKQGRTRVGVLGEGKWLQKLGLIEVFKNSDSFFLG